MRTIEMKDMGTRDEKGVVFNRTIVGLYTDEKPTGSYEGTALRDGDVFIAIGGSGGTAVYMYDETNDQWVTL